jgi:hypothetical protein
MRKKVRIKQTKSEGIIVVQVKERKILMGRISYVRNERKKKKNFYDHDERNT